MSYPIWQLFILKVCHEKWVIIGKVTIRLYIWYHRKLTLLMISQLWCYCGPSNYKFNFLLYWYAPWVFFLGHQCAFVFPIYVRKYRKYRIDRWIVVYTVCAFAVISLLKHWLDYYTKTCLKMCHTFKHFIHMQYFLLLTNLVIVFVHWVSTGVLYEPQHCSLFWDYIPESKLCFCVNLCHLSGPHSIRPIQKLLNCKTTTRGGSFILMGSKQKQRCGSEFAKFHAIQRNARTNEDKTMLI